jgi:hypothetical protein
MPGWLNKTFQAITVVVPIVRRIVARRRARSGGEDTGGSADDPRGLVSRHRKASRDR